MVAALFLLGQSPFVSQKVTIYRGCKTSTYYKAGNLQILSSGGMSNQNFKRSIFHNPLCIRINDGALVNLNSKGNSLLFTWLQSHPSESLELPVGPADRREQIAT